MKKVLSLLTFGLVLGIASMAFSATLVDVPSNHWAEDAVQKLFNSGLIEGYPDGTFKGDRPITRYEYAMVVDRMMEMLDKTYCLKDECKVQAPAPAAVSKIDPAQLDEIRDIVKKLAAEFKDELAALKVKVDENSNKIAALESKVDKAFLGKLQVSGSIRQRIDIPDTDLENAAFVDNFYTQQYNVAAANLSNVRSGGLEYGYEMIPTIQFDGEAGDNVTFSIALSQTILNKAAIADNFGDDTGELNIEHAYVDLDGSESVRELDVLTLRSGYQSLSFGPYGMLVDVSGAQSVPGVALGIGKDIVALSVFGGFADMDSNNITDGLGSAGKDVYAAARLGLDLPFVDLGFNYLGNGYQEEQGWGVDLVAPLLKNSPFLKEFRAEYLTVTDLEDGTSPASGLDDSSFVLGLDLYKNKKAALTVSYADIPAAVAFTSLDSNPFTEYDTICPIGLDVSSSQCISFESGRMLFPAGFEGVGVEASYIVLGDVELAAKGVIGNFAGGTRWGRDLDGQGYPGYGAFSVTKPINSDSKFRVEYMQQGREDILLNRVRSELLISF
ncbi:MAG TPA: S-layer homology domain-containing protein [bacterium]|nr:S-layer homology domain-containing protein [bacterium]